MEMVVGTPMRNSNAGRLGRMMTTHYSRSTSSNRSLEWRGDRWSPTEPRQEGPGLDRER